MARAQKCGGVQKKMTANRTTAAMLTRPVTAAQPTSAGKHPAAPPITMLDAVRRFRPIV